MSGPIDVAKFFESKVPLDEAAQQLAVTQLSPYRLANVAQHSFNDQRPTYVMHLDAQSMGENLWKIAIACSDNVAKLYDYNSLTGQLTFTHALRQHTNNINDIQFTPHPFLVCTASEDEQVLMWDTRSGNVSKRFKMREPANSCSCSTTTLAAAGETDIYLWDIQSGVQKQVISEFHTSQILRVRFHPTLPSRLFSASDDGTIMQFDLTIEDLDEAVVTVMNVEQPVSRFGFFGPQREFLFAISTVETLTLWECTKGRRIGSFSDIRQQLSQATRANIDYLINCHYDASQQRLFLAAGTFQGGLLLCHVNTHDVQPFCFLKPADGHTGVIRDSLFFEHSILTGGEDSKLCIWSTQAAPAEKSGSSEPPSSGPAASPSTEKQKQRKFKPYKTKQKQQQ